MRTQLLLILICTLGFTLGAQAKDIELYQVNPRPYTPINLEHASTPQQIQWGLMQRRTLPWNSGMTFNYRQEQSVNMWMFNMYLDISVAFLDKDKVIRANHELEAFPKKMDPKRPVFTLEDINRYPPDDKIIVFFRNKAVSSPSRTKYALEMSKGWFRNNGVKDGDAVLWTIDKPYGFVLHTIDLEPYLPKNALLSLLTFPKEGPYSVWLPYDSKDRDLAFLNKDHEVVKMGTLKGGGKFSLPRKPVMYNITPAKYLLTAPSGWLKEKGIQSGSKILL